MIIGISGYSQSGKDTLGKIIQMVSSEQKWPPHMDTTEIIDILPDEFGGWNIKKFAGKLKEVASVLTGVPAYMFESQEFKKSLMPEPWQTKSRPNMSYRDLLQILGTEAIRDYIHPNAWVNALMSSYTNESRWIITDVRFPNEAQAIKDNGGVVIRINRTIKKPVNAHLSETALDSWDFDFIINNDGEIADLTEPARMLIELKL